jgi:hypothetical protein
MRVDPVAQADELVAEPLHLVPGTDLDLLHGGK